MLVHHQTDRHLSGKQLSGGVWPNKLARIPQSVGDLVMSGFESKAACIGRTDFKMLRDSFAVIRKPAENRVDFSEC